MTSKFPPLIIGINGIAGAGKDTIANMVALSLQNDNGLKVKTFAFADRLKKTASVLFDIPLEVFYDRTLKEQVIHYWGMSPRQMLQKLGTEACRERIRDDIWLKAIHKDIIKHDLDIAFITDIRFDNEALFVQGKTYDIVDEETGESHPHNMYPGVVVHIYRDSQEKIADSAHSSEDGIAVALRDESILNVTGNPFTAAASLQRVVLAELDTLRSSYEF